jgi:hypothetical protein
VSVVSTAVVLVPLYNRASSIVSRRRDTGRWTGYVKVNYRRYGAGCFATEDEAVAAVLALRARLMPYDEPARHECPSPS